MTKVTAEHFRKLGAQDFKDSKPLPEDTGTWQSRARRDGWNEAAVEVVRANPAVIVDELPKDWDFGGTPNDVHAGCACEPAGLDGGVCPDANGQPACAREDVEKLLRRLSPAGCFTDQYHAIGSINPPATAAAVQEHVINLLRSSRDSKSRKASIRYRNKASFLITKWGGL